MTSSSRSVELQGSIRQFTLADIVQFLASSKRTGKLGLLQSDSGRAGAVYFDAGAVVHAEASGKDGEDAFFELMRWAEGGFAFLPDVKASRCTVQRNSAVLLMEGARQSDEWALLSEHIRDTSLVPEFVLPDDDATGRQITLNTSEWIVLAKIDGRRSVADIARETKLSDYDVCRLLYPLVTSSLIRLRELPR